MIVPINKIKIGSRIRQEYGDIQELADSIKEHGLFHPIVVDSDHNLVAGGRRLLACERNQMKEIEVKILDDLSEKELKVIELEENIKRKDLTEIEKSRALTKLAELKAEELREKAESEFRSESEQNPKGGRPQRPDSIRNISSEIGSPIASIVDAKQHVEAVDKYPELEDLPKYKAIDAAKKMDKGENVVEVNFSKDENYDQYLSKCKKTALAYNKSLYSLLNLDTSETGLKEWDELLDELLICGYVEMVEELIPKLVKIQRFLKEAKVRGNTNAR